MGPREFIERHLNRICLLGPAILALVCFAPALGGGFVYDDALYVADNPDVMNDRPLHEMFSENFPPRSPQGLYRPVTTLTLRLQRVVGGGSTTIFHLGNLVYHAVATLLAGLLLRRFGMGIVPAAVGATLFALHPTRAEVACWISARSESLAAALGFAALLTGLSRSRRGWMPWATFMLTALAALSKESAVMVAPIGAIIVLAPGSPLADRRGALKPWAAGAVFAVILKWFAVGSIGIEPGVQALGHFGFLERLAVAVRLLGFEYPLMTVWPGAMTIDHPMLTNEGPYSGRFILGLLGVAGIAFGWSRAWRKRQYTAIVAWSWFAVALIPYLHVLTPIGETAAQRFLYFPGLAFGLGAAILAERLLRLSTRGPAFGIAAILFLCALLSFLRAFEWKDERTLWEAEQERNASSPRANIALATLEAREADSAAGGPAIVARALDRILEKHPRHAETLYRRAIHSAIVVRRPREAETYLSRLEAIQPEFIGLQTLRGMTLRMSGRSVEGLEVLEKARAESRYDIGSRAELARDAIAKGRLDRVEVLCLEILEVATGGANHPMLIWAADHLVRLARMEILSGDELVRILREDVLPYVVDPPDIPKPDRASTKLRAMIEVL